MVENALCSEGGRRPNWHETFMLIAKIVSSRSTCNSRPTGAAITKDNHILAIGLLPADR
jgi:dCMP deaminase